METDKDRETLKGECDRFLAAYTEESTMRVSKEAYEHVISVLREIELRKADAPCISCGMKHEAGPVLKTIFMRAEKEHIWVVAMEMRRGVLAWVNRTRQEALNEMKETVPGNLPEELQGMFLAMFVVRPVKTTLEDLVAESIRPFHIIKWLRENLDHEEFAQAANHTATQEPASA